MKKVLVYGAYDLDNLGDDYMMYQVDQKLKENGIVPVYRGLSKKRNYFNISEIETLEFPKSNNKLVFLLKVIKWILKREDIKDIDSVICMGGGYTNEEFGLMNLLRLYFFILKFKMHRKKIYFTGQTVGPIESKFFVKLIKKIYSSAEKILVREEYSKKLLESYNIKSELVGDDAFLTLGNSKIPKIEKENKIIFNYKEFENYSEHKDKYFNVLYKFAESQKGYKIVVVPFRSSKDDKEYRANFELYNYLKKKNIDVEFKVERNIEELKKLFLTSKYVVGTAYHSIVLGLIFNNKVFSAYSGEYYKMKINGILDWFNISETNCIELSKISCEKIEKNINELGIEKIKDNSRKIANNVNNAWNEIIHEILEND